MPWAVHSHMVTAVTRGLHGMEQSLEGSRELFRTACVIPELVQNLMQQPCHQCAQQVYSLSEQNRFYKQAAAFCLRAVAKHSPELAQVGGPGTVLTRGGAMLLVQAAELGTTQMAISWAKEFG